MKIDLIVGLGNPGSSYVSTRHNAGFWLIEKLADNATFKQETRFHGEVASIEHDGRRIYLLKPSTYMNRSGQAVASLSRYYKIAAENILVVHDELDLSAGDVRLKIGGGHGGHNGLRDIASALGGNKGFMRLRIGIGHPGDSKQVVDYVLKKPSKDELAQIEIAIESSLDVMPLVLDGDLPQAQNRLHNKQNKDALA